MTKPTLTLAQSQNKYYGAGFLRAFVAFFGNYTNFTGRSTRSEYWWWCVWQLLLVTLPYGGFFWWLFVHTPRVIYEGWNNLYFLPAVLGIVGLVIIVGMALLVPSLAISVRRYRDAGWSWWWLVGEYAAGGLAGLLLPTETPTTSGDWWQLGISLAIVAVATVLHLVICAMPSKPGCGAERI